MANSSEQKKHEYLNWEFYEEGSRAAIRFGSWKLIEEPMHQARYRSPIYRRISTKAKT